MTRSETFNAPAGDLVLIHGSGNSAKLTALALAAANIKVALFANDGQPKAHEANSVLALSPSSRLMLEALGVWAALDVPCTPVDDMRVYGDKNIDTAARLAFGASNDNQDNETVSETVNAPLAHIVNLADLGRALGTALAAAIAAKKIDLLSTPIADIGPPAQSNAQSNALQVAHLTDGSTQNFALLVDTEKQTKDAAPKWRQRRADRPLVHDYKAAALVGYVKSTQRHANVAQQVFLPDGPLALLPLPDPHMMALVWSLPEARAHALVSAPTNILAHELQAATDDRFGQLIPDGAMAAQKLALFLAENYCHERSVLVGEAAHIIHPLAGQGFNLTLRDAAQLAETLYQAKSLGLPLHDATMLADYAAQRRSAALQMAAATHGLNGLFGNMVLGGTFAPLGRLGLRATRALGEQNPALAKAFGEMANGHMAEKGNRKSPDATPIPRLMQGLAFPHAT